MFSSTVFSLKEHNIDLAWSQRTAVSGFWDPDRVLKSDSGSLTPDPNSSSQANLVLTSPAAPASTVAPIIPIATTSAELAPKPPQVTPTSSLSKDNIDPGSSLRPGAGPSQSPDSDPDPWPSPCLKPNSRLEPDNEDKGGSRSLNQSQSSKSKTEASAGAGASISSNKDFQSSGQEGARPSSQFATSPDVASTHPDFPPPISSILIEPHTAAVLPNGESSIKGATTTEDAAPVTFDNTPISVASTHVMVRISNISLPIISPSLPSLNDHQIKVAPNRDVVIAVLALLQGEPEATIAGTANSLGVNGLIIGTSTFVVPSPTPALNLPIVESQQVQVSPNDNVVVGETRLSPGESGIVVSGHPHHAGLQRLNHRATHIRSTSSICSHAPSNRPSAHPTSTKRRCDYCRHNPTPRC